MLTSCCCWGSAAARGWLLAGATEGLLLASLLALVTAVSPVAVLELEPGLLELLSTVPGPL